MTSKKEILNAGPGKPGNPFKVPGGYFQNLGDRVMERISTGSAGDAKLSGYEQPAAGFSHGENRSVKRRKISMRPYLTLAASMSGLALIIYILLQTVVGDRMDENGYYDLTLLDKAGVVQDEAIIAEAYSQTQESVYSEWDEDAMLYLSSNEVDLIQLLNSN